jgi:hypothetical protein
MDRTSICNLEQPGTLFQRQGSHKLNIALNPINLSFFGLALGTVGCVNLEVTKPYRDLFERPIFPPCIHDDRHRRARAEGCQQ